MIPAVLAANDTLCAEDHTVLGFIFKSAKSADKLVSCVAVSSFDAPACEYLVCVVVMVVIVATAGAFLIVVMVMMLVVLVVVTAAGALLIVMMVMMLVVLVIVATAGAFLIVVMVMMLVVVVIVTAAGAFLIVMMVMMLMVIVIVATAMALCINESLKLILESHFLFHSGEDLCACDLIPICCYDLSALIVSADKLNCLENLFLSETLCMAEDDCACALDLIVEELTKCTHLFLCF